MRIPRSDLISQLGATIGDVKAREAIERTATDLGIVEPEIDQAQTISILDRLGEQPGIIGISAKCIRVRAMLSFGK